MIKTNIICYLDSVLAPYPVSSPLYLVSPNLLPTQQPEWSFKTHIRPCHFHVLILPFWLDQELVFTMAYKFFTAWPSLPSMASSSTLSGLLPSATWISMLFLEHNNSTALHLPQDLCICFCLPQKHPWSFNLFQPLLKCHLRPFFSNHHLSNCSPHPPTPLIFLPCFSFQHSTNHHLLDNRIYFLICLQPLYLSTEI